MTWQFDLMQLLFVFFFNLNINRTPDGSVLSTASSTHAVFVLISIQLCTKKILRNKNKLKILSLTAKFS